MEEAGAAVAGAGAALAAAAAALGSSAGAPGAAQRAAVEAVQGAGCARTAALQRARQRQSADVCKTRTPTPITLSFITSLEP